MGSGGFRRLSLEGHSIMFYVISFLSKRPDLTLSQFKDYYETQHVPLVLSLAKAPAIYTRRFIDQTQPYDRAQPPIDFDVLTELAFNTEHEFLTDWVQPLLSSQESHKVSKDEEAFIDRTRTRTYTFTQGSSGTLR
jgi:hypothetical protein